MQSTLHSALRPQPDSRYVSVQGEEEARRWAHALGTTPERLRDAVARVGNSVVAVRMHLAGRTAARAPLSRA